MPIKQKLQEDRSSESEIREELKAALKDDEQFEKGRVFYSMCALPPSISVEAHTMFIQSNLGDAGLYTGTQRLEKAAIRMLLALASGTDAMGGRMVAGGTEGNITALWMYRELKKQELGGAAKDREFEFLLPQSAHYSFKTAENLLGLRAVEIPLDNEYRSVPEAYEEAINESVIAAVATAGTTELGQLDPIHKIQRICRDKGIPLHVDAAYGGLIYPFLRESGYDIPNRYDFSLSGVTSIVVDPHKMGQATVPAGALLLRNPADMRAIQQDAFYLSEPQIRSILGTRCSAGIAAAYAAFRFYGKKGFIDLVENCMELTKWLCSRLKEAGIPLAINPLAPVVCVKTVNTSQAIKLQERLLDRSWRVSRTHFPPGIRFVIMPHVQKSMLVKMLSDLQRFWKKQHAR